MSFGSRDPRRDERSRLSLRETDPLGPSSDRSVQNRQPSKPCRYLELTPNVSEGASQVFEEVSARQVLVETSIIKAKFQIMVKSLLGNKNLADYVADFKQKLELLQGIPVDQHLFEGKQMEDQSALSRYSSCKDSTINLVLRLHGALGSGVSSTSNPVSFEDEVRTNSTAPNYPLSNAYIVEKSKLMPKLEVSEPNVKGLLSFY